MRLLTRDRETLRTGIGALVGLGSGDLLFQDVSSDLAENLRYMDFVLKLWVMFFYIFVPRLSLRILPNLI